MRPPHSLAPSRRIASFAHALRGAVYLIRSEPNAKLHAVATLGVFVLGWLCALQRVEWCLIVIVTAGVWITEALNTAIERLCDRVSTEFHPLIGAAKDVAATAVLLAAASAATVGALVFGPYLLEFAR